MRHAALRHRSTPTTYDGRRYRSRAEARWALFFDVAGVRFVYEPGPHHLPSGVYLVDFWLPDVHCYAEVKPECGFTFAEQGRCAELVRATGRACLLLAGAPCHQAWQQLTRTDVREVSLQALPGWLASVAADGLPALGRCSPAYVTALGRAQAETFTTRRQTA